MAKFKLIQKPTFKAPVMIQRAGYNAEKVEFEFKYLDRTALAELYTGWNERHDELGKQVGDMDLKAFTAGPDRSASRSAAGCGRWLGH